LTSMLYATAVVLFYILLRDVERRMNVAYRT